MTERTIVQRTESFIDACDASADRSYAFVMLKAHARKLAEELTAQKLSLSDVMDSCAPYLKDGETPVQRIERDRRDNDGLMTLLAKEKRRVEALGEYAEELRKAARAMVDWYDHIVEDAAPGSESASSVVKLARAVLALRCHEIRNPCPECGKEMIRLGSDRGGPELTCGPCSLAAHRAAQGSHAVCPLRDMLEKIARYPEKREEEVSTAAMRRWARDALLQSPCHSQVSKQEAIWRCTAKPCGARFLAAADRLTPLTCPEPDCGCPAIRESLLAQVPKSDGPEA